MRRASACRGAAVSAEPENAWRDRARVEAARVGVAAARRRLLIEWDRKREVWTVDGRDYKTLLEAENAITRPEDPLDVLQPLLNWDRPPAVEKP
jgi:hypothetical protein